MTNPGQIEKLKIYASTMPDFSDEPPVGAPTLTALVNPESYALDYKIEFNSTQAPGASGTHQRFTATRPEELAFELLFDATGIIDGRVHRDADQMISIHDELEEFKRILLDFEPSTHEPRFFKLVWGKFLFTGRCSGLTITYKLFNPDGRPIRATAKATFKKHEDEPRRVARESPASPDLTHHRIVTAGDTLPLMCYNIYGDARYYLQVARANGLKNFRNLQPGKEIFFPPIAKN